MQNKQSYITNYILSLSERSYRTKKGDYQIGFDWIIYQYGLFKDWQPIRYPFNLENQGEIITHKTEAEFGIDLSFYDSTTETIIVFLLKADKLTYNNWIAKSFDGDLRRAINPDLQSIEIDLDKIKTYKIITAYNKSDDKKGIESYENFIKTCTKKIYETIKLEFERWNIDRVVKETTENLLSANILPNNLSGLLSYISSQVSDFEVGTKEWEYQLVPNWKNFLDQVFITGVDERKLNLIPFSLAILKKDLKKCPSSIIGWIDLIEYAVLKLWDMFPKLNKNLQMTIIEIWRDFYINELITYFNNNHEILTMPYGLRGHSPHMSLISINTSYLAYWHLGRLGLLCTFMTDVPDEDYKKNGIINFSNYIESLIGNNPSCYYPLLDINHIELYLIFVAYLFSNKRQELFDFFLELGNFLCIRRMERTEIPFISSRNRLDLVAEYVATREQPIEWNEKSSYLLTMLLEMFTLFEEQKATELIDYYFKEIIDGIKDTKIGRIDLVSWVPDADWQDNIFKKQTLGGTGIGTSNFCDFSHQNVSKLELIKSFINEIRERDINMKTLNRPFSAYILACMKNKSPLPPEFWRVLILGQKS